MKKGDIFEAFCDWASVDIFDIKRKTVLFD